MAKKNVASGDDQVAVQVGQVGGLGLEQIEDLLTDAYAAMTDRQARFSNTVSGNAQVGAQYDRVVML